MWKKRVSVWKSYEDMVLWHYNLIKLLPNIELYNMQILCQAVISQVIELTSDYRYDLRKNGNSKRVINRENKYIKEWNRKNNIPRTYHESKPMPTCYAMSDMLAYRWLIFREMRKRKLPIWQLNFPWPYQRMGFKRWRDKSGIKHIARERTMIKSNPMCSHDYYLFPMYTPSAFKNKKKFGSKNPPQYKQGNDDNLPNLLVGAFTNKSYLYQYALLLERSPLENIENIQILNKYRKIAIKDNCSEPHESIDPIIIKLLNSAMHICRGLVQPGENIETYIVGENGEINPKNY